MLCLCSADLYWVGPAHAACSWLTACPPSPTCFHRLFPPPAKGFARLSAGTEPALLPWPPQWDGHGTAPAPVHLDACGVTAGLRWGGFMLIGLQSTTRPDNPPTPAVQPAVCCPMTCHTRPTQRQCAER